MQDSMIKELIKVASQARKRSYSPYSKFSTGAAVLTDDGRVFSGTNIENSSYGLTICAERIAIFKAVEAGCRGFKGLVVIADTEDPVSPCGACRQVLSEFGDNIPVIMTNIKGEIQKSSSNKLLPGAFSEEDMQ